MRRVLPQPCVAINAEGAHPYFYMQFNYEVVWNFPARLIFSTVKKYIESLPAKHINALIIHCHGYGEFKKGKEWIGEKYMALPILTIGAFNYGFGLAVGTGIDRSNVSVFKAIKGLVSEIYLTGCGAAEVTEKADGSGDGMAFCSAIARYTGAQVYASKEMQWTISLRHSRTYGLVEMDDIVYQFKPNGSHTIVVD